MQLRAFWVAALMLTIVPPALPAEPIDPDPAQIIAQKFSEASEPQPAPNPAAPDLDYELDMLRRARAEQLQFEHQDTAVQQPVEAIKVVAPAPVASPAPTAPIKPAIDQRAEPVSQPRTTVLLVLDERNSPTGAAKPDPIICFGQTCWISNGIEDPAHPMPRTEALALKSTRQAASDSCRGKSGCVFRNVAVGRDARIEVFEIGEGRVSPDGAFTVSADATCRNDDGDLFCDAPLITQDYRLWIVPETTAQAIGSAALEEAVADGLPDDDDGVQTEDGK
jgi:hypothetical protein